MKARRLPVRIVVPLIVLPVVIALGMKAQPTAATGRQYVDARTIYLRDCAVCHGADGHGTDDGPTLQGWGRAGVDYALTTGRMPLPSPTAKTERRPPHYDAPTIAALEDYIAALVPGGPDIPRVDVAAGSVSNGGEIYRAQCAACHEWAGDGGALLEREAPPLGAATPAQIAEAVRIGPSTMPVFGQAALSDADLNGVVGYVEYLDHPDDRGGQPLWHLGPVAEGAAGLAALAVLLVVIRLLGSRP